VSKYAASLLSMESEMDIIIKLAEKLKIGDIPPPMNGWIFEMWFFANLRKQGVTLYDHKDTQTVCEKSNFISLRKIDDIFEALSDENCCWMKPLNWNQPGYDAIFIDKEKKLIRFVQITISKKHSFNIEHFYSLLKSLSVSDKSFEILSLEIVFVVDRKRLKAFQLNCISGQGLLNPFGWKKQKETDNVQILGIETDLY
jgi:hypothetical protein